MNYFIYFWQGAFCPAHYAQERWPWFLAFAFTGAASASSYYLAELPLQQWGRRLTKPQISRFLAAT